MKSILPEYITITSKDAFTSMKYSLEDFNEYMKSTDLQKLINEMENSQYLFELWKESLNKALEEAKASKE